MKKSLFLKNKYLYIIIMGILSWLDYIETRIVLLQPLFCLG